MAYMLHCGHPVMYYHIKFGHPASNSIKICSGQGFPLMSYKGEKVGHSDLVIMHNTALSHDVLPHQVW